MLKAIDGFIILRFEGLANAVQVLSGWCTALHLAVFFSAIFTISSVLEHLWFCATWGGLHTLAVAITLPEQLRNAERGLSNPEKLLYRTRLFAVLLPSGILVPLALFLLEFDRLGYLLCASAVFSAYLEACDPLPRGPAKIRQWLGRLTTQHLVPTKEAA